MSHPSTSLASLTNPGLCSGAQVLDWDITVLSVTPNQNKPNRISYQVLHLFQGIALKTTFLKIRDLLVLQQSFAVCESRSALSVGDGDSLDWQQSEMRSEQRSRVTVESIGSEGENVRKSAQACRSWARSLETP